MKPSYRLESTEFGLEFTGSTSLGVALEGVLDDLVRHLNWLDLIDFDCFALKVLVILEESLEHLEGVFGEILDGLHVLKLGIIDQHRDDLVVGLTLIDHGHHTDRTRLADTQRRNFLGTKHEHIQRVKVLGVGLWDESIVSRVLDRAGENAIKTEHSCCLVEFVLIR